MTSRTTNASPQVTPITKAKDAKAAKAAAAAKVAAPKTTKAVFENCPKCGHKFSKPKAQCSSKDACERRQRGEGSPRAQKSGTTPKGKSAKAPKTDRAARKAGKLAQVEDLNERLAAHRASKASPAKLIAEATGNTAPVVIETEETSPGSGVFTVPADAKPIKVKLGTLPQEAFVDGVLEGAQLRSGRAGHWLLVHPNEAGQIQATFRETADGAEQAIADAEDVQAARRTQVTAAAIAKRIDEALAEVV